jgi:DNA-binding SARP family transcriptional activator
VRFEVLGPLQVWRDSTPVPVKSTTQRRILAALLARSGGQISVGELVDALWPDDPPPNSVKNAQSYVAKLKSILGESGGSVIDSGPGGYRISVDPSDVDAHEFTQNLRRAKEAHAASDAATATVLLSRALRLWRGHPYNDLRDWPFLQPEIERLNQLRLEVLELGIELRRHADLLPALSALVDENPYQERPAGLLMRALQALGRQAEAQQVNHRTRTRLAEDLGVDPTSELRRQYESLLRGERASGAEGRADPARRSRSERSAPVVLVDRMPWPPKVLHERQGTLAALLALGERQPPVVCAIIGARGVGKTQLAAAYARDRIAGGWTVVWIDASSRDQLIAGYADLADFLGLRYLEGDFEHAARQARRWLGDLQAPALLVLDDAAGLALVREWLPQPGGVQVVVTSNRRTFGWLGELLELDVFTPAQARDLLTECTGLRPNGMAVEVAKAVGHHPLALTLAAAVITGERLTYREYVDRLAVLPTDDVLGAHEGDPYPRSMSDAIWLSLEMVERRAPGARSLTELIAALSAAGVGRSLLVPANLDEPTRAARFRLLGILLDASLLTYREDGQTIVMHPLTRRVVGERAAREARLVAAVGEAIALLGGQFRSLSGPWTRQSANDSFAHLETLLGLVDPASLDREQVGELLALCTETIEQVHDSYDAIRLNAFSRLVLAQQERVLGIDDPATMRSRASLGRDYRLQGRLDDAIGLLERTLAEQEKVLGAEHADTLRTRYDLGATHLTSGHAERAIAMLQQTIATQERAHGGDHPGLLIARKRLALANRTLGRLEVAAGSYEALIPALERVLGPGHLQTLRARSELACVHRAAGRVPEAIAAFEHTLADVRRILGPDHSDAMHERDRLAGACRAAGRTASAIGFFSQTVADWERLLEGEHQWTLMARNNLACALASAGRLGEAGALLEQTLGDYERVRGAQRPRGLNVRNNVGCVLQLAAGRGRSAEAVALLEAALAGRERVLGAEHPDTATSRHNLAVARGDLAGGDGPYWLRNGFAYASGHSVDETIRL